MPWQFVLTLQLAVMPRQHIALPNIERFRLAQRVPFPADLVQGDDDLRQASTARKFDHRNHHMESQEHLMDERIL